MHRASNTLNMPHDCKLLAEVFYIKYLVGMLAGEELIQGCSLKVNLSKVIKQIKLRLTQEGFTVSNCRIFKFI